MIKQNKFIKNTFLLTAVSLGLRAVGISFNVYVAGKIGASGMGLFSLIMSVYSFGVTFACSGINLASTKIVSEEIASGNELGIKQAVRRSLFYSFTFGSLAFFLIFIGAPFVSSTILGDERCIQPLMILSISLPCVSMSSSLNGYFNAVGRVYKGALVQVAEQIIRVLGCVVFLENLSSENVEKACTSIVLSGCFAEIISFALILIVYKKDSLRYSNKRFGEHLTKRLIGVGIPIAVSSYVRSGLSTIEHALIPKGLKKYGSNAKVALSAYGTVHGMVMPLIFFPSSVLQAFSSLLIPEFTKYAKCGKTKSISHLIEKSLSVTLMFSIGISGIMFFFADEIGKTVYKNNDISHFLRILAPLVAVMYADGVVDAILKGLNQQVYSMGYNIIDSALAIVLLLVLLPQKGINGYIITIYATEMVNAFLSINRLIKVADFKIKPFKWTVFPYITVLSSSMFIKGFCVEKNMISAVTALLIYFVVMLLLWKPKEFKTLRG